MAKNTRNILQQTAIPDLSGYLQLQSSANKSMLDSIGKLGAFGEDYNKIQSDVYNNPLLDRLKRVNNESDLAAVQSQIDPIKASQAVRDAETAQINKFTGLNKQLETAKLFTGLDINDPNYIQNLNSLPVNGVQQAIEVNKKLQEANKVQSDFNLAKKTSSFYNALSSDFNNDGILNVVI